MKNNNILAIIPARAGSKGLKNKNILKLGIKNIINITIDQALKSKYITKVSVSTDSKRIKDIVNKKNVWCEKLRPKKISGDKSKLYDAIKFVIDNINYKPDIIVELHPTHVFRSKDLIDSAIKKYLSVKKKDSLISVLEVKNTAHPDYIINLKKNFISFKKSPTNFNRNFLKNKKYQSSGIILVSSLKSFLKNKSMVGKKCIGFIVKNDIEKIDINSPIDYEFCKFLVKNDYKKF